MQLPTLAFLEQELQDRYYQEKLITPCKGKNSKGASQWIEKILNRYKSYSYSDDDELLANIKRQLTYGWEGQSVMSFINKIADTHYRAAKSCSLIAQLFMRLVYLNDNGVIYLCRDKVRFAPEIPAHLLVKDSAKLDIAESQDIWNRVDLSGVFKFNTCVNMVATIMEKEKAIQAVISFIHYRFF